MFTARLIEAPATTPVTLAEAKQHLAFDESHTAFNSLINSLIKTATTRIEDYTQRGLVEQTWELVLDKFPAALIELPMAGPLRSIESVTYKTSNGSTLTIESDKYTADTDALPGRLVLVDAWPSSSLFRSSAVKIRYTVGFDNVPEIFKTAILFYTGMMFESRSEGPHSPNTSFSAANYALPKVVKDLLYTHRIASPMPFLRGI